MEMQNLTELKAALHVFTAICIVVMSVGMCILIAAILNRKKKPEDDVTEEIEIFIMRKGPQVCYEKVGTMILHGKSLERVNLKLNNQFRSIAGIRG